MTKTVSGVTTIEAQYGYDPYGIATKLQGSQDADFQYAGYYMHAPSGLNLTVTRQYSANLGRWISRDPIEEEGCVNLYTYVGNMPTLFIDPLGLYQYGPSNGTPPPSTWSPAKNALVKRISERLDAIMMKAVNITRAAQVAQGGRMTEGAMGVMADCLAKRMAEKDPFLSKHLIINWHGQPAGGPDFVSKDANMRVWWDMTTEKSWARMREHQDKFDAKFGYGILIDYYFERF